MKVEPSTGGRIEDFGEKIGGARKDLWGSFRHALQQSLSGDVADITVSKFFPEPSYEKLISEGVDVRTLGAYKAIRDSITTKPKLPYKLKTWGEQVRAAHALATSIMEGSIQLDEAPQKLGTRTRWERELLDRITLYGDLGYPDFLTAKDISLVHHHFSAFFEANKPVQNNVSKWVLERPKTRTGYFDSRDQALQVLREGLAQSRPVEKPSGEKSVKFDLYRIRGSSRVIIGKKIAAGKYIDLKTFDTVPAAREYLAQHQQELELQLERLKSTPFERRAVNALRTGPDRRDGRNVTAAEFAAQFGFVGRIEFGNTMPQGERQEHLNRAWDAFMDLAEVMQIPPEAISLNGSLGIGFGSRGTGGKNAAAAHFEQDKIAINLTRENGAGALGHEWWHALDNYFSRMRGRPEGFVSSQPIRQEEGLRPEIAQAYQRVVDAINKDTQMTQRAKLLDGRRSKDYWGSNVELTARAFERYLIDRAQEFGIGNDYLANVVNHGVWRSLESMSQGSGAPDTYPFPSDEEAARLNPVFASFANALYVREVDGRQQLYSIADDSPALSTETGMSLADLHDALVGHASLGDLAGRLIASGAVRLQEQGPDTVSDADRVQGFTDGSGSVVLCAKGLTPESASAVMLHELFHARVDPLMGTPTWKRLMGDLERLYDQASHGAGAGPMASILREARRRVGVAQGAGDSMSRQREVEEFGAYAVELAEKAPPSLRRWVGRLLGHVKAWALTKLDVQLGEVTPEQLRALAVGAMRDERAPVHQVIHDRVAYSISKERTGNEVVAVEDREYSGPKDGVGLVMPMKDKGGWER